MDPAEMTPIMKLKERTPATVGYLCQTLGFLSYYRPFSGAHLLYNMLTIPNTEEHTQDPPAEKHKKIKKEKGHLPSRTPIEWTSSHQEVLNQLIDALTKAPVLHPALCVTLRRIPGWFGRHVVSASSREDGSNSVQLPYPESV